MIFIAKEAKGLPDLSDIFSNIGRSHKKLLNPFLQVSLGSSSLIKTDVKLNELYPVWNEEISIPVCHYAHILKVEVKDWEHNGNETVGWVDISIEELLRGEEIRGPNDDGWHGVVIKEKGSKQILEGKVCFFIKFIPATDDKSGEL